jgi:TRAP-type mannitol/chloroaromatic compound transport system permease large subunit
VNVGDLFLGALIPGLVLSGALHRLDRFYAFICADKWRRPCRHAEEFRCRTWGWPWRRACCRRCAGAVVLGTIFFGIASPTEAGAMGAFGATILAAAERPPELTNSARGGRDHRALTSMVFIILVGATAFAMVFNALGGTGWWRIF